MRAEPSIRGRRRRRTPGARLLTLASLVGALVVGFPILSVFVNLTQPTSEVWGHLAPSLIQRYTWNTALLVSGTTLSAGAIGIGVAWLVVAHRFLGRDTLAWVLILPLAFPSYVLTYAYYDLLAFGGPVQSGLRALFDWGPRDYWFPRLASLPGAIFVLTFALYPYVYLAARAAFLQQSRTALEVSRTLGEGRLGTFRRVTLPLARPGIVVGLSLVAMETIADYGAVALLGVQTFTTGIYKAWFSMGDPTAAAQLAALLLVGVLALVLAERALRRGRVTNAGAAHRFDDADGRLGGPRGLIALLVCLVPVALGAIIPAATLVAMALRLDGLGIDAALGAVALRSLGLAAATALIAAGLGLLMVYGARLDKGPLVVGLNRLAALGYAVPGPVIAVGVLVPLAALDRGLGALAQAVLGAPAGPVVTGSALILILAYLARFMTVSLGAIEAGFAKVRPSLEDAASTLGVGAIGRLFTVHAPLIWPALGTCLLLVFVDVMKELPVTLILRPFNFDTLAVRTFNLAADERLAEAALPALVLVLVGLAPVILLSRQIRHGG